MKWKPDENERREDGRTTLLGMLGEQTIGKGEVGMRVVTEEQLEQSAAMTYNVLPPDEEQDDCSLYR